MVILVVGPSGVGKSDYGRHLEGSLSGCRFYDLDGLVSEAAGIGNPELVRRVGDDGFLALCRQQVDRLVASDAPGAVSIVAVGAGALQSSLAKAWFATYPGPTVAVAASPDEVYERGGARNAWRSLSQFKRIEFSRRRRSIHGAAKYRCDVADCSVEEARSRFAETIAAVIDGEGVARRA